MSIDQLEAQIRDFINNGRRQSVLLQNLSKWNELCSALDVIGDTTLAILAYPSLSKTVKNTGATYLLIYGILQTLQLQQDAAKKIGNALNIKVKLPKKLNEIRTVRNDAAGHPFASNENNFSNSSFINRSSISPILFELMTTSSNNRGQTTNKIVSVNIPELIEIQEQYLSEMLTKVVSELKNQEMAHKNKYKDIKICDLFLPTILNYPLQKIYESLNDHSKFMLGKSQLKFIQENCIEKFKSELVNRNEWDDSVDHEYDMIVYSINELEKYFEGAERSKLNHKDALIFLSFLDKQIGRLKKVAQEVDEDYESIS